MRKEVKDVMETCERSEAIKLIRSKLFAKSDKQNIFDFNSKKLSAKVSRSASRYGIKRSNSQKNLKEALVDSHEDVFDDLEAAHYAHLSRTLNTICDIYTGPEV